MKHLVYESYNRVSRPSSPVILGMMKSEIAAERGLNTVSIMPVTASPKKKNLKKAWLRGQNACRKAIRGSIIPISELKPDSAVLL
jgi:hypothetical protein